MLVEEINFTSKIGRLPPVSDYVARLLRIIDNPWTTRERVLEAIVLDRELFESCINYANAISLFKSRTYDSILEIVELLGLRTVKCFAILNAFKEAVPDQNYWFKNIFIAHVAKFYAEELELSSEFCNDVFMAALFENYGDYAFKYLFPQQYDEVNRERNLYKKLEQERRVFGMTYFKASARILNKWGALRNPPKIILNLQSKSDDDFELHVVLIEFAKLLFNFDENNNEAEIRRAVKMSPYLSRMFKKYDLDKLVINEKRLAKFYETSRELFAA